MSKRCYGRRRNEKQKRDRESVGYETDINTDGYRWEATIK